MPRTPSIHRLRCGLPGYLILFATHAFAPQCQCFVSQPPSPPVFLQISTDFTPTPGIPPTSQTFKICRFGCSSQVKPRDFTSDIQTHLRALYAQSIRTMLAPSVLPRLLARSSPVLISLVPSDKIGINYSTLLPNRKSFTTQGPSSLTWRCCIRLSPIVQDSPLLPPVGVWTVSQFQCD